MATYSLDATFVEITLVVLSVSAEPTVAIVVHVALTVLRSRLMTAGDRAVSTTEHMDVL